MSLVLDADYMRFKPNRQDPKPKRSRKAAAKSTKATTAKSTASKSCVVFSLILVPRLTFLRLGHGLSQPACKRHYAFGYCQIRDVY